MSVVVTVASERRRGRPRLARALLAPAAVAVALRTASLQLMLLVQGAALLPVHCSSPSPWAPRWEEHGVFDGGAAAAGGQALQRAFTALDLDHDGALPPYGMMMMCMQLHSNTETTERTAAPVRLTSGPGGAWSGRPRLQRCGDDAAWGLGGRGQRRRALAPAGHLRRHELRARRVHAWYLHSAPGELTAAGQATPSEAQILRADAAFARERFEKAQLQPEGTGGATRERWDASMDEVQMFIGFDDADIKCGFLCLTPLAPRPSQHVHCHSTGTHALCPARVN